MIEKLRPYAIQITHVRGETNFFPDYLSRNPTGDKEAPEITTFNSPSICNKRFRLLTSEVDVKDFYIQQVAEEASKDPDYISTVQAIRQWLGTKELKDDSEAKKMEGQWEQMGILDTEKGELVIRNDNEVLIPRSF